MSRLFLSRNIEGDGDGRAAGDGGGPVQTEMQNCVGLVRELLNVPEDYHVPPAQKH